MPFRALSQHSANPQYILHLYIYIAHHITSHHPLQLFVLSLFTQGSFLDFDWSDGEVVFANSTCFDDALMLSLSHMVRVHGGIVALSTVHLFKL